MTPLDCGGRIAAVVGLVSVLVAIALPAAGQQPLPLPNQKDVDRVLNPQLPQYENPLDKRIEQARKALGLPPQPKFDNQGETSPSPVEPGLSSTVLPQLDRNQDGFVSREEYMSDRQRGATVGALGTQRYMQRYHRFDSRFRAADTDRDGRLSPDEIDAMQGRRF